MYPDGRATHLDVALATGTRNRESMWHAHPDNATPAAWAEAVAALREAAAIGAEHGVKVAFEPEVNNVVDSARKARRVLDAVGSPHLKVVLDGANVFHAGELGAMAATLDEAFALLGGDIALAHAKDLDGDGDAGHLPAGYGLLDYDCYPRGLRGYVGSAIRDRWCSTASLRRRWRVAGCVAFLEGRIAALPPV